MTALREAAQHALEALHSVEWHGGSSAWMLNDCKVEGAIHALRAALAEHYCDTHCTWADHAPGCVMEERNFCPRCGKRNTGIHTCTPPAP